MKSTLLVDLAYENSVAEVLLWVVLKKGEPVDNIYSFLAHKNL